MLSTIDTSDSDAVMVIINHPDGSEARAKSADDTVQAVKVAAMMLLEMEELKIGTTLTVQRI